MAPRLITMPDSEIAAILRHAHARGQAQAHMAGIASPGPGTAPPFTAGGMFAEPDGSGGDLDQHIEPHKNVASLRFSDLDLASAYNTKRPIRVQTGDPSTSCDIHLALQSVGQARVELYANVPNLGPVLVDTAYVQVTPDVTIAAVLPPLLRWVAAGRWPTPVRWEARLYTAVGPLNYFASSANTLTAVTGDDKAPTPPHGLGSSWVSGFVSATNPFLFAPGGALPAQTTAPITVLGAIIAHNAATLRHFIMLGTVSGNFCSDWPIPQQGARIFSNSLEGLLPSQPDAQLLIHTDATAVEGGMYFSLQVK